MTDKAGSQHNKTIVAELVFLLNKGNAHASFEDAVADIDEAILGKKPHGCPYSIWQLAEHIRITQHDLLDFCTNPGYQEMNWPEDYWPKEAAPAHAKDFHHSIQQTLKDRKAFIELLQSDDSDLYQRLEHGSGQTLLREALVMADHNSYHTAEIVLMRRFLGDWKK